MAATTIHFCILKTPHSLSLIPPEDNFIHQLGAIGGRLAAIGDDTWQRLFPGAFHLSRPFDSFNTNDLDTVDDGVEDILDALMLNNTLASFDLFIAHFLGVDHIGHTLHAFHPMMQDRLLRMDTVAQRVISHLPSDCVFILMGDHGMTSRYAVSYPSLVYLFVIVCTYIVSIRSLFH